ncbi:isopentenyl-diphosphate Delta-isomerase [uncultured Ferrimonas sp.]|uniref:isopentenyl-diphosphate Delta-isomerase n=1 Tax=uncultured Ferrimonas sp. TaxID=432640 RepID=UPI002603EC48|nr:isopentenyl-diphosphate Delta-isomerase [uncultured Ferrimonas sp.]
MQEEHVVVVDEQGVVLGTEEKMAAHRLGLLHRAFSVFIFNDQHQLMLQQRALHKYHSGGLWTNTCCSHPRLHESYADGAQRRLFEEMGFHSEMKPVFEFIYRAELDKGMIEHELDHVFFGYSNTTPQLNPEEAAAYRYVSLDVLDDEMKNQPEQYTEWFKIAYAQVRTLWLERIRQAA